MRRCCVDERRTHAYEVTCRTVDTSQTPTQCLAFWEPLRYAYWKRIAAGNITDGEGRPLMNAVLHMESLGRGALTDRLGAFEFQMLPPDTVSVLVECGGYKSARFRLPLVRDATRRAMLALARDSTRVSSTNCAIETSR